jgi:predicted AlkP superfamily phosphohydrolase/phosphomutase
VSRYKVDGIPTKFVINKEGRIRFKSVGGNANADKIVNEMTAMIELAEGGK